MTYRQTWAGGQTGPVTICPDCHPPWSWKKVGAEAVHHGPGCAGRAEAGQLNCCRIANLVEAGITGRQTASRYLKALASAGVLREQSFGRETLFVHRPSFHLIDSANMIF